MSAASVARPQPRRLHKMKPTRDLDYLYDSACIVTAAKDYARISFKAAMGQAQLSIQPVFKSMFSDLRTLPRQRTVVYPNCRMPRHMDASYESYLQKQSDARALPTPQIAGRDLYKYTARPKVVLEMHPATPDFHPPTPRCVTTDRRPRNRGTQSLYRESSAQTIPWQPDAFPSEGCQNTPEVLFLKNLEWGPGKPYRNGDLPADFHTTEIINKMRHARVWNDVVDTARFPRWMKGRVQIIKDVETNDWIFREAEIDELQGIRLGLLHKLQAEQRNKQSSRTSEMLSKRWKLKKSEMEAKVEYIRRVRDREIRKLVRKHQSGGRLGAVDQSRAMRGMGSLSRAAFDRTSDLYAPVARHGIQARNRHVLITYDPTLLLLEDHVELSKLPEWMKDGVTNLRKTCSGNALPQQPNQLCERETKWSEDFLEKLHQDLIRARLGAAAIAAGPLYILKARKLVETPRPKTPETEAVSDEEERGHQAALVLQRLIRGRAVQYLMYEGRTRAAELTEELKSTHGLQKEDKIRIAKEEAKARDYNAHRNYSEKKEDSVTALVDELCGSAVSAALDFLEKELRRLKEERRQHAFIMIALREKQMREAAEAGRRQKEELRRREHDEMFKQVVGVTQDTVESYLQHIILEGVALSAEEEAVRRALHHADQIDAGRERALTMSTAEQNELVAELVHQFLLPTAHKTAAKHRIEQMQKAKLDAARKTIFGLLDGAEIRERVCTRCGVPLGDTCRCTVCPVQHVPRETTSRQDQRWRTITARPETKPKEIGERYPAEHDFRCMLNTLIDEVVEESRQKRVERDQLHWELLGELKEHLEMELEAKGLADTVVEIATGAIKVPLKEPGYHYWSRRVHGDALARTEPARKPAAPTELPSAVRRRQELEEAAKLGTRCVCVPSMEPDAPDEQVPVGALLPSQLRRLEEMRMCKCDRSPEDSQDAFALDFSSTEVGSSEPEEPAEEVAISTHRVRMLLPEDAPDE